MSSSVKARSELTILTARNATQKKLKEAVGCGMGLGETMFKSRSYTVEAKITQTNKGG